MLSRVGAQVKLVPGTTSDALDQFRSGRRDAIQLTMSGTVDPSLLLTGFYTGGLNLAPESQRAQIASLAERGLDPRFGAEDRAKIYREIFKIAVEQVWTVPICFPIQLWAYKSNVANVDTAPWHFAGAPDFRYVGVTK
jgi:ABC-type transport system substrate-binding protein